MKTNKDLLMDKYETLVNSRIPGKGPQARQIVANFWDSKSDTLLAYRLKEIDLSINDNLTLQVLKDLAIRFPTMNEQIKALKSI